MALFNLTKEQLFNVTNLSPESITVGAVERNMCFSVMYATAGNANLQIGCNSFLLTDNTILLLFQNDLVKFAEVSDSFSAKLVLLRSMAFQETFARLEQYIITIVSKERIYTFNENSSSNRFINNLLDNLLILSEKSSGDYVYDQVRCHVRSLLTCLFDNIEKNSESASIRFNRIEEHFCQFIKLLAEHCRQSREVVYYAELMNITPKYLNYICNYVARIKCKAIIDRYAISQIKNDLMMTDKTIQEISYDFNFANQSFFGSYFKKFMRVSPRAFRTLGTSDNREKYQFDDKF